jgi:hypothetical protein
MPFTRLSNNELDPPIKLRQSDVNTKDFEVLTGFRYDTPPGRTIGGRARRILVRKGQDTDLVSIPFIMRWYVQTYGKHTRAAILHDVLWRARAENLLPDQFESLGPAANGKQHWQAATDYISVPQANEIFRIAMGDSSHPVGAFKAWVMWTAVTLEGKRRAGGILAVAMYAFIAVHLACYLLIGRAIFGGDLHWLSIRGHPLLRGHDVFGVSLWWTPLFLGVVGMVLFIPEPIAGLIASEVLLVVAAPVASLLLPLGLLSLTALIFEAIATFRHPERAAVTAGTSKAGAIARRAVMTSAPRRDVVITQTDATPPGPHAKEPTAAEARAAALAS